MSVPRILLLTGTPPGDGSVGELFLRDLVLSYPRDRLCCFAVTWPGYGQPSPKLQWLPITYQRVPREHALRPVPGKIGSLIALLAWQYAKRRKLPRLITEAIRFGQQHKIEMVWAVLNRPMVIEMARHVASALDARLVTTVWDPPEYNHWRLGIDKVSRHMLLNEFEKIIRTSHNCSVASEGMQDEYRKRYDIESVVLIHGVHPHLRRPPAVEPNGNNQFIIGFAGYQYTHREWQALLSALGELNWCIAGRDVTLRFMGFTAHFKARGKTRIEYLGWRSLDETVELLSQTDITYLPYWFDEAYGLAVRLCFPNKLTAYLAAGRPVLFHGPEDSSPGRFFRRFPVGLCCHSLEEARIIESLHQLATDREFYALATLAGQAALDQELNLHVFRRRFAQFVGVEESQLLPLAQAVAPRPDEIRLSNANDLREGTGF